MTDRTYKGAKAFLILTIIIGIVGVVPSVIKWGDSMMPARTMTVSADAKATVAPDLATVSFSEVTIGTDPLKIETDNVNQINSAVAFVKQQGVSSDDIATTDYNLSPNYNYNYKTGKTAIVSYTITETETLKIRDFTKIAPILSGLANLGVNQIGQVSFSIENPDSHLADARAQAFASAQSKAQQMAAENGVTLGKVVNLTESSGNVQPQPMYSAMSASSAGSGVATPTIEPGTQQLTEEVSVTYAIQ